MNKTLNEKRILGFGSRNDNQSKKLRGRLDIAKSKFKTKEGLQTNEKEAGGAGGHIKAAIAGVGKNHQRRKSNRLATAIKNDNTKRQGKAEVRAIKDRFKAPKVKKNMMNDVNTSAPLPGAKPEAPKAKATPKAKTK